MRPDGQGLQAWPVCSLAILCGLHYHWVGYDRHGLFCSLLFNRVASVFTPSSKDSIVWGAEGTTSEMPCRFDSCQGRLNQF
jgi:hypothetical protein